MKIFATMLGLGLASMAWTMPASAQLADAEDTIVVTAEYQRDWDRGARREAEGLRDMEEARRDLVKYSAELVSAQDAQESARNRAENARAQFGALRAREVFVSPDEARSWAQDIVEGCRRLGKLR